VAKFPRLSLAQALNYEAFRHLAAAQFAKFERQGIAPSDWGKEQAIVKKQQRKKPK